MISIMQLFLSPVFDGGNVVEVVGSSINISERKTENEMVQAKEEAEKKQTWPNQIFCLK
ncbi:hypothetical protein GCM10020331_008980 [Ectobacillus funiculus]